ncbi:MAG: hypothetical protein VX899_25865 [Myxococcota bacterium]|nr:hypothetical protein [Myxococcota bacterium]
MLTTLHSRLDKLRRHPRAQPWQLLLRYGLGGGADSRSFVWLAPPSEGREILQRLHNGLLLLQPAAAELHAPVAEERLEPFLEPLRSVHKIPIAVNREVQELPTGTLDLPSRADPWDPMPAGAGVNVGLDIGGTGMKCCAMESGRVVSKASQPTWPEGEHGIESLVRRSRGLVQEVAQGRNIGSLGIGFASPMGVDGSVVSLSTVMRKRIGDVQLLDQFAQQVASGLTQGPLALFNDLTNLGRHLSGQGNRRMLRLQIGTSFGGCWIDADGTVNPTELGRLVIDARPDARPHTYLPLRGAMKTYLSGLGVAQTLETLSGAPCTAWQAGYRLAEHLQDGDEAGRATCEWIAELLFGVIAEAQVFLGGLRTVEVGGSMLQGVAGRRVKAGVLERLDALIDSPEFRIATDPGYDGAIAAAHAPLLGTPLRGLLRLSPR